MTSQTLLEHRCALPDILRRRYTLEKMASAVAMKCIFMTMSPSLELPVVSVSKLCPSKLSEKAQI
jgi:hypothetical protein